MKIIASQLLIFVLIFNFISQAKNSEISEQLRAKGVTILTDSDFEQKTGINYLDTTRPLAGDTDYVILFFVSWCPHCQHFIKDIYIDIMEMTSVLDFKIIPSALQWYLFINSSSQNPKTSNNFRVQGYPEIHYFRKDGGSSKYPRGSRTKLSVLKFIQDSHEGKQYIAGSESNLLDSKHENEHAHSLTSSPKHQVDGQKIMAGTGKTDLSKTKTESSQKNLQDVPGSNKYKSVLAIIISTIIFAAIFGLYKMSAISNSKYETQAICNEDKNQGNEQNYVFDYDRDAETPDKEQL